MKYCTKCGSILIPSKDREPVDYNGYTGQPRYTYHLTCPNYVIPVEKWRMGMAYSDGSVRYPDDRGHIQLSWIDK
jgi:hypothetical protein